MAIWVAVCANNVVYADGPRDGSAGCEAQKSLGSPGQFLDVITALEKRTNVCDGVYGGSEAFVCAVLYGGE